MRLGKVVLAVITVFALMTAPAGLWAQQEGGTDEGLFAMSLGDLLLMDVSSFTLTKASNEIAPGASTNLGRYQIEYSGARTLNELIELYVPNAEIARSGADFKVLGLRGINMSPGSQFIYSVNGVGMNMSIPFGPWVESVMPLMGDIHTVSVLRGPGSVTAGPGALTGLVDVKTYTGLTFEGMDFKLYQSVIDTVSAAEIRYGKKYGETEGLFIYYGAGYKMGAGQENSRAVYGHTFEPPYDVTIVGGEPVMDINFPNDNSYPEMFHKFHIDYTKGGLKLWARYTKDGVENPVPHTPFMESGGRNLNEQDNPPVSVEYFETGQRTETRKFTVSGSYQWTVSETLKAETSLTFDSVEPYTTFAPFELDGIILTHEENELSARALLTWTPKEGHALAAGVDAAIEWFDLFHESPDVNTPEPGPAQPEDSSADGPAGAPAGIEDKWNAFSYGLLGEYQWTVNEKLTAFAGLRLDKHRYMDWEASPRLAAVWHPSEKDTAKLILSHSVRRANDLVLRTDKVEPESLDLAELRFERQHQSGLRFGASLFYENYDAFGTTEKRGFLDNIGTYQTGGLELEANYKTTVLTVRLSHSYTKLLHTEQRSDLSYTQFTVEPNGFGDDIVAWSNHISKAVLIYEAAPELTLDSSLIVYWGFPGMADYVLFNTYGQPDGPQRRIGLYEYKNAYGPSAYLNLGVHYEPSLNFELRVDLYNVTGWLDDELTKRNYIDEGSGYWRSESPAVGVSIRYAF